MFRFPLNSNKSPNDLDGAKSLSNGKGRRERERSRNAFASVHHFHFYLLLMKDFHFVCSRSTTTPSIKSKCSVRCYGNKKRRNDNLRSWSFFCGDTHKNRRVSCTNALMGARKTIRELRKFFHGLKRDRARRGKERQNQVFDYFFTQPRRPRSGLRTVVVLA